MDCLSIEGTSLFNGSFYSFKALQFGISQCCF